ncbi:MAG: hypothetical protein FWD68_09950 [Alphaproteobacteria bacterium]|nr:hypothetical protein [Alphaproteobacteria bacterium]
MTAPSSSTSALTGTMLTQFLDSLESDLERAGSAAFDLQARLAAQELRPDTFPTLARLSVLWFAAGVATLSALSACFTMAGVSFLPVCSRARPTAPPCTWQ